MLKYLKLQDDRVWACSLSERLGDISKGHFGLTEMICNRNKTEGSAELLNKSICLKQKTVRVVK